MASDETKPRGEIDLLRFVQNGLDGAGAEWSRSGRLIAAYLRDNWEQLPYQTGASIAAAVGLSEMTVIRFIRQLGFANLKEFKAALRPPTDSDAEEMGNIRRRLKLDPLNQRTLEKSLGRELEAVAAAYRLTTLPRWGDCVEAILKARQVSVLGFQASRGLAIDFSSRLQYVRPGVRYVQDNAGILTEVFDMAHESHCLVLVDTHAYARKAVLLAQRAREMAMPLIFVTDSFTNRAYDFTEMVLQGETYVETFWDSPASLAIILNLLIDSVANRLGGEVSKRTEQLHEMGHYFAEFDHRTSRLARSQGEPDAAG
ncbi:MurR/RpiR family transcriptional regulator [Paracoccus sp. MKU1]|uniref:MurR/RpiR family transcriptional regulator n=1 Tax=Paracoccus sp. MKU1 TaxID=1745182 RepID=UPI0007193AAE|nr:MurR/RpiR family transcriptional regulator [Paracoccus sp. MKU1]KRW96006.1 hypothetical protein AQY21_11420 [Paracoccus sp. MKU1]